MVRNYLELLVFQVKSRGILTSKIRVYLVTLWQESQSMSIMCLYKGSSGQIRSLYQHGHQRNGLTLVARAGFWVGRGRYGADQVFSCLPSVRARVDRIYTSHRA